MHFTTKSIKQKLGIVISLTDFVEYVTKTGTSKLTVVKSIKKRPGYHPIFDYWKKLRDAIDNYHNGKINDLHDVLKEIIKDSKKEKYKVAISKYLDFIKNKKINWFEPPSGNWRHGNLVVKLNPELGLEINGEKFLIKLYFKDKPLSKNQAKLILTLMNTELRKEGVYSLALLDINAHKLYTDKALNYETLIPLLIGEATSFETIWNSI